MKRHPRHLMLIAIALVLPVTANPQGDGVTKRYEKDGLSFDYPADWSLVEETEQSIQTVTLRPNAGETQITVSLRNGPVQSCDFQATSKEIAKALTDQIATQIKAGAAPHLSSVKTQIGDSEFDGTELHGVINNNRATGSVLFNAAESTLRQPGLCSS